MSLTTPLAVPAAATRSRRSGLRAAVLSIDVALLVGLALVGLGLRLPYLWTIPRFTDETREVLLAIEVLHGRDAGLVNVDAYIGGLYLWLLAGIFWLTGVSALTPRLVMAVAGALAVALTYLLARDLGGRRAGLIAAGLLATSGGYILSNGHIAWSHCLTPTLTTLAAWLLQRAVRAESRVALLGSGLAFGLALQTHPATLVLLPGAALYVLWQGRRWLRTPWPYLALALFLAGYANVIVYNLMTGFNSFDEAAVVHDRYSRGRDILIDLGTYLSNHGVHGLMLLRYLAGAVDARSGPLAYLVDPTLWLYGGLSAAGLLACARRGASLPLLMTLSSILVMPYFNERKYVPISDGRYLMPLLPLAFAATGALLASGWRRAARHSRTWSIAFSVGVLALVLYPLLPLARYYGQELTAGRTNEPLLRTVDAVKAARRPDEAVLLHTDLRDVKLEGGGTAFRALRFLLMGVGIDDRSVDDPLDYARDMRPGASALVVAEARGLAGLEKDRERLRAIGVEAAPVFVPDSSVGYGAVRLERRQPAAWSAPLGRGGLAVYARPDLGEPRPHSHTAGGESVAAADNERDSKPKAKVPIEVLATGLVNPRGLAFRSDGNLIVASAGNGGPEEIDVGREKPQKYGRTGQILRITPTGDKFLLAKNLPALITAVNEECGPSAIAFIGDRTYVLMASGGWEIGDPEFHSGIYELLSDGRLKLVWDMTQWVYENPARARREDPRADVPGGMAYGMAAMNGKLYVTDANQEQLLEVDPQSGTVRRIFEYPKSNRALTGIAAGPDGALYVAEWASNKVTRISLDGKVTDAATKLRVPIGVTFGPDGAMYVVEFTGRVLRSAPVGQEQKDILVEGLRAPTAITFGPDGNLYVSVFGQGSAQGEGHILRVQLAPDPPAKQAARWANGAAWAGGLIVFVALMLVGWKYREDRRQARAH